MRGINDYIPKGMRQTQRESYADLIHKMSFIVPSADDLYNSDLTEYTDEQIANALNDYDIPTMREISNYYYRISSIYKRIILYFATISKFYWIAIPTYTKQLPKEKITKNYNQILKYLNNFRFQDKTSDIINTVFREGAFYGYLIESENSCSWQKLPAGYCRSIRTIDNIDVVEFNIMYFDEKYTDAEELELVLKRYPPEFKKWRNKYLNGKVPTSNDGKAWVPLDINFATRFCISEDEIPFFYTLIPEINRLQNNKKQRDKQIAQSLYKLLVQKMPLDKNSVPIFDNEETKEMHQGTVNMLKNAVGMDILTTWATTDLLNVDSRDRDDGIKSTLDDLWTSAGSSPMLFNTTGNLSLNFSQLKDSGLIDKILEKYSTFINKRLIFISKNRNIIYSFKFLDVTRFNEKDKFAMYKELGTLGYSKLLIGISSGINQMEIPNILSFENDVLDIGAKLIPLQSSYTSSGDNQGGRPEKNDDEKSDKTVTNINLK